MSPSSGQVGTHDAVDGTGMAARNLWPRRLELAVRDFRHLAGTHNLSLMDSTSFVCISCVAAILRVPRSNSLDTEQLIDEVVRLNRRLALAASRCSDFGGPGGPSANWSAGKLGKPAKELPPQVGEQFRKNGHVVLRNFISPEELAHFASEVRETVVEHRHDWDR